MAPERSRGVPWGYVRTSNGGYAPDSTHWRDATAFLETLIRNKWRISAAVTEWRERDRFLPFSDGTLIRRWLLHPVLRGGTPLRRRKGASEAEVKWGTHPALIDATTFQAMSAQLEVNRKMWGNNATRKPRLLTGLCRCACCGTAMSYAGGRSTPALLCKKAGCSAQYASVRESTISAAIQRTLRARAFELVDVLTTPPERTAMEQAITELERLETPEAAAALEQLREKQRREAAPAPDEALIRALQQEEFLSGMDAADLRELYQQVVQEVLIRDRAVERVELRF